MMIGLHPFAAAGVLALVRLGCRLSFHRSR